MTANASTQEILQEHLRYDVDMLEGTFRLLNELIGDVIIGNALNESFCIHARGLIEFLTNHNKGVIAASFTDDQYAPFRSGRVSKALVDKLNTQIAHLTLKRTLDDTEKIGPADRQEIIAKIRLALDEFERHLKPELKVFWTGVAARVILSTQPQPPSSTNAIHIVSTSDLANEHGQWVTMPNTVAVNTGVQQKRTDNR